MSGTACNMAGTGCVVDPASTWTVTAISARVDAGSYNVGSLADPYLCIGNPATGQSGCTPFVSDNLAPTWNHTFTVRFAASTLMNMSAGFRVSLWDDDFGPDNIICSDAGYYLRSTDFGRGPLRFMCGMAGAEFILRFDRAM